MGKAFPNIKKAYMGKNLPYIAPCMNRRNVFGGEHLGPIYGSSYWAPYTKRRKAHTHKVRVTPLKAKCGNINWGFGIVQLSLLRCCCCLLDLCDSYHRLI